MKSSEGEGHGRARHHWVRIVPRRRQGDIPQILDPINTYGHGVRGYGRATDDVGRSQLPSKVHYLEEDDQYRNVDGNTTSHGSGPGTDNAH